MNFLTMPSLFQHANGYWYIRYNRKRRRTLSTKDGREARSFFRRARREYLEGKIIALSGGPPRKSLLNFWEEYEEHRFKTASHFSCQADRQAFRVFLKELGADLLLSRITRLALERSLANIAQRVSRTSANTWFRHFKAALSKAREWGFLKENPAQGVKQLPVQQDFPRFLTEMEFDRLLRAETDPLFRLFWQFQVYGGARRRESLGVTIQDIKPDLNRIDIGRTKNGKPKAIILNDKLRAILAALNRDVGRLWPWQPDSVTHHFQRTARAAGLACRLHDLRHTYGSWLVQKGVPLYTVGKLMGHQDTKTTGIYAHLDAAHLEEAAGRL